MAHQTKTSNTVSCDDALSLLGVKRATLYTYVSRGWIRSVPTGVGRKHGYLRDDIDRMRARSIARTDSAKRIEGTLRFGDPVITTRITEITPEGPRYRNRLALDLAKKGYSFESVAVLLWTGAWTEDFLVWDAPQSKFRSDLSFAGLRKTDLADEFAKFLAGAILAAGVQTKSSDELKRGDTLHYARHIIQLMVGYLGYLSTTKRYAPALAGKPLAMSIARSLGVAPTESVCFCINAMMVLCADYELTPATFTTRIVASAGADIYASVAAGLCAHSGTLTGLVCDRLEEILLDRPSRSNYQKRLDSVRRHGFTVYGFNHPLYPRGDPRARWMIELAHNIGSKSRISENVLWFLEEVENQCGMHPGLQAGLVALQIALKLPRKSAQAIWAIARTAGQVAHMIEQRSSGHMLRPRARYVSD